MDRTCVVCSVSFSARGSRVTCSVECRQERIREQKRKYRAANREHFRELARKHYAVNAERVRERVREYCKANPERRREQIRKYYAIHAARIRERERKKRAEKREAAETLGEVTVP